MLLARACPFFRKFPTLASPTDETLEQWGRRLGQGHRLYKAEEGFLLVG
jgi:hypothetical protein